jgi:hypothetical protein
VKQIFLSLTVRVSLFFFNPGFWVEPFARPPKHPKKPTRGVHPKFLQAFFLENRHALVSRDEKQKDEKNQARWRQEPVEKKPGRGERVAQWEAEEGEEGR